MKPYNYVKIWFRVMKILLLTLDYSDNKTFRLSFESNKCQHWGAKLACRQVHKEPESCKKMYYRYVELSSYYKFGSNSFHSSGVKANPNINCNDHKKKQKQKKPRKLKMKRECEIIVLKGQ